MFRYGGFSTKNLYLVELQMVLDIQLLAEGEWHQWTTEYTLEKAKRYSLGYKNADGSYIDIFTGTFYTSDYVVGMERVASARAIITNRKKTTKEEATLLLKELNSVYLDTSLVRKLERKN